MSFGDKLVLGDGLAVSLGAACQHPKLYVTSLNVSKDGVMYLCPDCNEWITLPECGGEQVQTQEGTANAQ